MGYDEEMLRVEIAELEDLGFDLQLTGFEVGELESIKLEQTTEDLSGDIDLLIPYARNSRTHSDSQVTKIASSIKEFGFLNPVIVDKDNGIIAGHGRVMAAKKLGLKKSLFCLLSI